METGHTYFVNGEFVTIIGYSWCNCGAITLFFDNGASNSMYKETFEKLNIDLSDVEEYQKTYCCDHCVNHWGIDQCQCGSGADVGDCPFCNSNEAHDTFGVKYDSYAGLMRAIGIIKH